MSSAHPDYTLAELCKLTRVSRRTVRNWISRGLLPPVAFRGQATRYGQTYVTRILAIKRMRADFASLDDISRRLASVTADQLNNLVHPVDPNAPRPVPQEPSYPSERWERVVLLPGLELNVRDEPGLRQLAQQIYQYFGPRRG